MHCYCIPVVVQWEQLIRAQCTSVPLVSMCINQNTYHQCIIPTVPTAIDAIALANSDIK